MSDWYIKPKIIINYKCIISYKLLIKILIKRKNYSSQTNKNKIVEIKVFSFLRGRNKSVNCKI